MAPPDGRTAVDRLLDELTRRPEADARCSLARPARRRASNPERARRGPAAPPGRPRRADRRGGAPGRRGRRLGPAPGYAGRGPRGTAESAGRPALAGPGGARRTPAGSSERPALVELQGRAGRGDRRRRRDPRRADRADRGGPGGGLDRPARPGRDRARGPRRDRRPSWAPAGRSGPAPPSCSGCSPTPTSRPWGRGAAGPGGRLRRASATRSTTRTAAGPGSTWPTTTPTRVVAARMHDRLGDRRATEAGPPEVWGRPGSSAAWSRGSTAGAGARWRSSSRTDGAGSGWRRPSPATWPRGSSRSPAGWRALGDSGPADACSASSASAADRDSVEGCPRWPSACSAGALTALRPGDDARPSATGSRRTAGPGGLRPRPFGGLDPDGLRPGHAPRPSRRSPAGPRRSSTPARPGSTTRT